MNLPLTSLAFAWLALPAYAKKIYHETCHIHVHHAHFPTFAWEEPFETMMHRKGYEPIYYTWKDNSLELQLNSLRLEITSRWKVVSGWRPNTCTVTARIEQITSRRKNPAARQGFSSPGAFILTATALAKKSPTLWSWTSNVVPCEDALWRALNSLPNCKVLPLTITPLKSKGGAGCSRLQP